ncbi:MAG: DUF4981 domain-containing protein [Kiritimatiellae bacterium]|nr:DUF4981 domain-containing protein [Kiritimatiellia bacterium]
MRVTTLILTAAAAAAGFAADNAVVPEWENLAVNSVNRLPARTYSMPLADEKAALTDAIEPSTPYKLSLNGEWKISWAGNPDLRVKDFWKAGFDDSAWFKIDVPSCVEMRGFGSPGYVNVRYPHANKWPRILDRETEKADYNPVSSYRRSFKVPAEWKDRDVILRFDGVYSAYYVWVNGQFAGYAEDSKLPSEFDITKFLTEGENQLAVEVYRWCDGSYIEDQDMFRYSGIYRDVTLWAKPRDGIWDFKVNTWNDGRIEVKGIDGEWTGALYDADFLKVAELSSSAAQPVVLKTLNLWSAEKPYLYTLVLKKGADIRAKRVGFKTQTLAGNVFLVNGMKVKFKGVNRHECSADNGRSVSLEEMTEDVKLMKRYNINTVRTCHYPDHHLWYDLCDRYGIYVVAEANIEAHEPGYGDKGLGRFPEWSHSIVERNERNVVFHRNNPCVTMWSMGNETGHGVCFTQAIAAVKAADPTRPVHWERGNEAADVDSSMYPTVEWLDRRGRLGDVAAGSAGAGDLAMPGQTAGKVFFLCEYAHAMGNAIGNFHEYWDVFYKYDSLAGGCIWDWVDQAVWKYTDRVDPKTGARERYLAYGGDFDETPNDGPFCCNGVVGPLREVTAKLVEVGHVYRNLVVTRSELEGDNGYAVVFDLVNRHCFTRADEFLGVWQVRENGVVTKGGAFETPALEPLSRCRFTVPGLAEALAQSAAGAELFVDIEFRTKTGTVWADKGWTVSRNQIAVSGPWKFNGGVEAARPQFEAGEKTLTVRAGGTRAVFCRDTGTLSELEMNGVMVLKDPAPGIAAGPQFTCIRAFTDNDCWMREGKYWAMPGRVGFFSTGLSQLRHHARPIVVDGDSVKVTTEVTGSKSGGFTHEAVWTFSADGAVSVANSVTPHGTMPPALPRMGLSLKLDKSLETMRYYGRGPRENYIDRLTGSFLGVWKSTVTEQYEAYVRPQDNGYKCDVRWVEFTDAKGAGVRFSASEPLFVQALHYGVEDLEFARHRNGQKRYCAQPVKRGEVCLNLDVRQLGLGGASCGPAPMKKYIFPIEPVKWALKIEAVK